MAHWRKKFAAKPDDQPESDSWGSTCGKEPTPANCPVTSTWALW